MSSTAFCVSLYCIILLERDYFFLFLFCLSPPSKTEKWIPCSYSLQSSLCLCAVQHVEDERRVSHMVFLCVSSILGSATSPPLYFRPLNICEWAYVCILVRLLQTEAALTVFVPHPSVKPDPPSDITAKQVEGSERKIEVTWNSPPTWKEKDLFYGLKYEIRYRQVTSAFEQVSYCLTRS